MRLEQIMIPVCAVALALLAEGGHAGKGPPRAELRPITDEYFGVRVTDPYRYMEEPGSPELTSYLQAQNDYTNKVFSSFDVTRSALVNRLERLQDIGPQVSSVQRILDRYFYLATPPGAQSPLLMTRNVEGGQARVVYDPATVGNNTVIDYFATSWSGTLVIIGLSRGGSESSTLRIFNVETNSFLPEAIPRTRYAAPAWDADNRGFYYSQLQATPPGAPPAAIFENEKVFHHLLGTDSNQDKPIFGPSVSPDVTLPRSGFSIVVTSLDGRFILAGYTSGTIEPYAWWVRDLRIRTAHWRQIATHEDGLIARDLRGSQLFVISNKDASNGRVLCFDVLRETFNQARVLVPESDVVLTGRYALDVTAAGDALYVTGAKNGVGVIRRILFDKTSEGSFVPLPFAGNVFNVIADLRRPGISFGERGWTQAPRFFRFAGNGSACSDTGLERHADNSFANIASSEVEVSGLNGAKIPLSILYQKDLALDGSHPTILEAYGAYGVSLNNTFTPTVAAWIERGGVYAIAHVRGGGEKGEGWHAAGRGTAKQNSIEDALSCARFLIEHGYTSPRHIAVYGRSAGGIVAGGAVTQNPSLFRAAVIAVGILDMLRFEKTQGGPANVIEFGTVADPDDFAALRAVSPYANVRENAYPAMLIETAVQDTQVPAWQSAKMAARLQECTTSQQPILLRVAFDAGHGRGETTSQYINSKADEYAFLGWQLGLFSPP